MIAKKFCAWQDSIAVLSCIAVVSCTKFWGDLMTRKWMTVKGNCDPIGIVNEKSLVKWVQGSIPGCGVTKDKSFFFSKQKLWILSNCNHLKINQDLYLSNSRIKLEINYPFIHKFSNSYFRNAWYFGIFHNDRWCWILERRLLHNTMCTFHWQWFWFLGLMLS